MATPEELREIARAGNFDWHGYDNENVVNAACEYGPEFLEEILSIVEEKGGDAKRLAWEIDDDGYTAMYLYAAKQPKIMAVFAKHGVFGTRDITSYAPFPSKDHYESYNRRHEHASRLAELAREIHGDRMRPDGAARRIDHAKNVVAMMERWSVFGGNCHGWRLAAAWCLGMLEDAERPEVRVEIDSRILGTFRGIPGEAHETREMVEGHEALAALWWLALDETSLETEADHLRHVSVFAKEFAEDLAVADRLCLVREWLDRKDVPRARNAFEESRPLFEEAKDWRYPFFSDPYAEKHPSEIDVVREELEAAEQTASPRRCAFRRAGLPRTGAAC